MDYIIHTESDGDYLAHYGVLGMKWGVRHDNKTYSSTSIRARIARTQNNKVDKSFKNWKENSQKRDDAIELGKKSNEARLAYEKDRKNKDLKKSYKDADKAYRKALKSNTTYRKGQIRGDVGSDLSRKYLSEAKKIKKRLDSDPTNRELKKQYDRMMSKHDIERAKARKAPSVGAKRSARKAALKRSLTMTVKAAAATAAVAIGVKYANQYLSKHDTTLNGRPIRMNKDTILRAAKIGKKFYDFGKYVY